MGQGIVTTTKYKVIIGVRFVRLLLLNGITDSYIKLFMNFEILKMTISKYLTFFKFSLFVEQ